MNEESFDFLLKHGFVFNPSSPETPWVDTWSGRYFSQLAAVILQQSINKGSKHRIICDCGLKIYASKTFSKCTGCSQRLKRTGSIEIAPLRHVKSIAISLEAYEALKKTALQKSTNIKGYLESLIMADTNRSL